MEAEIITTIGSKIKDIRISKELTVEEVATRAGVDLEYYRAVEENREVPALGCLVKIVRVLGIRLGTLLDDQQEEGPVITRASEQKLTPALTNTGRFDSMASYFSLCRRKADRHLECFILEVKANRQLSDRHSVHEGEEFLYIIKGEAKLMYGKKEYILKEGDTIYYDSIVPHNIASASESEPVTLLAVIYIPA